MKRPFNGLTGFFPPGGLESLAGGRAGHRVRPDQHTILRGGGGAHPMGGQFFSPFVLGLPFIPTPPAAGCGGGRAQPARRPCWSAGVPGAVPTAFLLLPPPSQVISSLKLVIFIALGVAKRARRRLGLRARRGTEGRDGGSAGAGAWPGAPGQAPSSRWPLSCGFPLSSLAGG